MGLATFVLADDEDVKEWHDLLCMHGFEIVRKESVENRPAIGEDGCERNPLKAYIIRKSEFEISVIEVQPHPANDPLRAGALVLLGPQVGQKCGRLHHEVIRELALAGLQRKS